MGSCIFAFHMERLTTKKRHSISLMFLLLCLVLYPSINGRAGPQPYSGAEASVDDDVIQGIFGDSYGARYGQESDEDHSSEEEDEDGDWIEIPVELIPEDVGCGPMQVPKQEPEMSQLHEEYTPIEVIKAKNNMKCDFYKETEGYECVPYYQCDEGTIITDGYGLIDIRFGGVGDDQEPEFAVLDSSDLMCPGSLDVCCKDPDFVKQTTPQPSLPLQSTEGYGQQHENEQEVCAQVLCCGSDGITYPTPCEAPKGVECVSNVECPEEEQELVQTEQYTEVCAQVICCGTDGVTYSTPCDLPEGVECASNNVCETQQEEEPDICVSKNYGPEQSICGTDNIDYTNTAHAACAGVTVDCEGTCPCDAVIIEPYKAKELQFQPQCGRRNEFGLGVKINNYKDDESQFGEWPHMCAVLRKEVVAGVNQNEQQQYQEEVLTTVLLFQGGASLISSGVVMTGAHKVIDFVDSPETLVVRCGEWDTQTDGEPLSHQERKVAKVITHPEYNPRNMGNTIALLILETNFSLADHIDTICLPEYEEVFDSKECFVKGWGKDVFGAQGEYQVVLKKVGLPMVERNQCQDFLRQTRLGKRFRLDTSHVCAGGEEGRDACRGDGGGPLVCKREGEDSYYQVGVVAWGIGCGDKDVPGVYTDVAKQVCWIDWALNCHLDNYKLRYGEECNEWLDGRANKKFTRRDLLKLKSSCPEPNWPKKVVPEPYSIQEQEQSKTTKTKQTLPGKIKSKTKNIKDNQAFPQEGGY